MAFDPKKWAEETPPKSARQCCTCGSPKLCDALRVILQAIADRRSHVSLRQIHEMAVENFDYQFKSGALRQHMQNCEPDLFSKAYKK